jgi:predicted nucleotidyltransferase component of viral defense system
MIDKESFTKEWLLEVNRRLGWNRAEAQLKNLEKAISALYLLEQLRVSALDFIFKGGTSLMLLFDRIYRLSVDVDILMEKRIENINAVFDKLCASSELFTKWEKQDRENPMSEYLDHYQFFYTPFTGALDESYILLDIYYSESPYARTIEKEIISDVLHTSGAGIKVTMPDAEGLLSDKLAAFAPRTTGVQLAAKPPKRPKRVEAIKQLYDVGNLFDRSSDLSIIRRTYNAVAEKEIINRKLDITPAAALDDSVRFSLVVGCGGSIEPEEYNSFAKGYRDFSKFVADLAFDENDAVLAAAKVVYLVSLIKSSGSEIEKYDDGIDMSEWELDGELGEYKYSNPEAFFYWYKSALKLS